MKKLEVSLGDRSYNIHIGRGIISSAAEIFSIGDSFAFIVTDEGVPEEYAKAVASGFKNSYIYTVAQGEGSKSLAVYGEILEKMLALGLTRGDVCIAVGGGVVGDLSGFAAASYMRGIDFYNVPTTVLSMVDSSIGGKTAINLGGAKNIVGAFYQPRGVLIDTAVLDTLPERQIKNGLAESIKMAATSDEGFFEFLEKIANPRNHYEEIIARSIAIKRSVVEADEREGGLRKILNFGHTFGHAIEAYTNMDELYHGEEELKIHRLYHGECVAIGMMAKSCGEVRSRISSLLEKYGLPTEFEGDINEALKLVSADKKRGRDGIDIILVKKIGKCEIAKMSVSDFADLIIKNTGRKI